MLVEFRREDRAGLLAQLRWLFSDDLLETPVDGQVNRHVINLTVIAFYWLLRPAEYTHSRDADSSRSQAFTFGAACITVKRTPTSEPRMYAATDPYLNDVQESQIFAGSLTFADQKNGVRGEQVAQRANCNPDLCPAKALFRLTQHLRDNRAPPLTPLCAYHDSQRQLSYVKSSFITNGLRHAAGKLEQFTGIDRFLLSARSLRPGGATALLCAGIDSDVIKLLGHWKSDAMFRYLRIQVHIHQDNISQRMLDHGSYTFAPGKFVVAANMPLPRETPRAFADDLNHYKIND
jgi:hypothetical protein